ncbi:MAG: aromatic acid exporter family protein [Atribacterota bacterium]
MFSKRKTNIFLGARTIKTGIAVTLSLFLSNYIPYSMPLLAGAAAIICMQPSITVGIQKGLIRTKATLLGGLFGLLLHYIFGNNLFAIGAGVSMVIWICHRLKWEEGIALASLIAMAVMLRVSAEVLPYTTGRVISTLIGIVVATFINTVIAPPRYRNIFLDEMNLLAERFTGLYLKIIEAYIGNNFDLAQQIDREINDIKKGITGLRQKLNHLLVGAKTPLGTFLEGSESKECLLFERAVHCLVNIVAKIEDIVNVTKNCYARKQKQKEEEKSIDSYYSSKEFAELEEILQDLSQKLGPLHTSVFNVIGEQGIVIKPRIYQFSNNINKLKELLGQCLKYWGTEHIEQGDIYFLMATHRVILNLEEVINALTELALATGRINIELIDY